VQFPVHIELHRSRILVFSLSLFHALAITCAIVLPWPWLLRSLLLAPIGVSGWYALRPQKIIGLRLAEQGRLDCLLANGERTTAEVLSDSTVFNQLIVLRMRLGDTRRVVNLALLPDSVSAEQFRVLRLWLRWQPSEGAAKSV